MLFQRLFYSSHLPLVGLCAVLAVSPLAAQDTTIKVVSDAPVAAQDATPGGPFRAPPPSISTSAEAEVKVTPDRATIRISVQTKAQTAAAAAADNAVKQNTVLSALRKLGIPNDQLSTVDYTVEPQYRYPQDQEPVLMGYTVTNTLVADVRDIAQVGKVIDTALGSGANMISSLEFYASNTTSARRQAISDAVAKARIDADAAAHASGGSLGGIMELNVGGEATPPRPMFSKVMAANNSMATPINPGQQSLTVNVEVRWMFIPPTH